MFDWLYDREWIIPTAVALIIVLAIIGIIFSAIHEEREWKVYATDHHCIAKGTKKGQTTTGVGPTTDGRGGIAVTTTTTADQTIYVCDGGEIQIR